jgi:hypothetical protein
MMCLSSRYVLGEGPCLINSWTRNNLNLYLVIKAVMFSSSTKFFGLIYPPTKLHITYQCHGIVRFVLFFLSRTGPAEPRTRPKKSDFVHPYPMSIRENSTGVGVCHVKRITVGLSFYISASAASTCVRNETNKYETKIAC